MASAVAKLAALIAIAARSANAACCPGAAVGSKCYASLSDAIKHSNGTDIMVGGKIKVSKGIRFAHDISLVGDDSCGSKPVISGTLDYTGTAILEASGDGQTIKINGIDFEYTVPKGLASAIRTTTARNVLTLDIQDASFSNFRQDYNGSAIYIGKTGGVTIGDGCVFKNNEVVDTGEGGGTLYIEWVPKGVNYSLGGQWLDNNCIYSHCEGAAAFVETIEGSITVTGTFKRNTAPDGAAVHFRNVKGTGVVDVGGIFEENVAEDRGEGNRGGAVRTLTLSGAMTLSGNFTKNSAPGGRGGVIAINNIRDTGTLTMSGKFTGNSVTDGSGGGGVISVSWTFDGAVVLDKAAVFEGTVAPKAESSSLYWLQPCSDPSDVCRKMALQQNEEEYNQMPKETRTITYTGPSVEEVLTEYKASLVAEYGESEEAQIAGLKEKYGDEWEKYYISQEQLDQFLADSA